MDKDTEYKNAYFHEPTKNALPVNGGGFWYDGKWNAHDDARVFEVDCPGNFLPYCA